MGHYVVLIKLNEAGASHADQLPDIMKGIADAWNAVGSGAKVYAVNGQYDLVAEGDAENAVDMAWLGAHLAENGVSTCTLQAFAEDEVRAAFEQHPTERRYPILWFQEE